MEVKSLENVITKDTLVEKARLRTYNFGEEIAEDDYCLWHGEERWPIAAFENIMLVTGREKSRKSLLVDSIVSSFFNLDYSLGFRGELGGKAIIHIDTEQPLKRFKKTRKRFFHMAGIKSNKDAVNYFNYNLRPFSTDDRLMVTDELIYELHSQIPIGVIVIDGIVDLCRDYNDGVAVRETSEALMRWTDDTKALLIGVLHTNRGGKESNGVLGSTMDKKADVCFRVELDEDIDQSAVGHYLSRERKIPKFHFNQRKGLPNLLSSELPF